jgi:hypothetical protein
MSQMARRKIGDETPTRVELDAVEEGRRAHERGEVMTLEDWHRQMVALRADVEIGLRELDAGLGKELDIADVIKQARRRHR